MAPLTYLTNIASFCAAHRLHNLELTDEKNRQVFGRCNHISSHGHNYRVEATIVGEIVPEYGFAMNLRDLKLLLVQVTDPMDHKRLDTDIDFFKEHIATAEWIAIYIWDELGKLLPDNVKLYNIRVHETDKNYVDYRG